jgi:hypothetical protein
MKILRDQRSIISADDRPRALGVLRRRYVRERQHVMRFCQHAARIGDQKFAEYYWILRPRKRLMFA